MEKLPSKSTKQVRFSKRNETCIIECRGQPHTIPDPAKTNKTPIKDLDDEVKDHPAFVVPILTENSISQKLLQQIEKDPNRKTVVNPITGRDLTRFGSSYWKMIQTVFGSKSTFYIQEKHEYKRLYKSKT
jgi:hypothetical protein